MIACPVCDGTILTAASVPREPGLVRCAACSLVFRPGADDDPVRAALSDSERRLEERVAERRAKHFETLLRIAGTPGRLLDVGTGVGTLLRLAGERGWRAVGVDVDPAVVAYARARGLDVRLGELGKLELPAESFDLVTLWNVIDFVADPVAMLHECHRVLVPGGRLFVRTPNVPWQLRGARLTRLLAAVGLARAMSGRARWLAIFHRSNFAPATLRFALARAGFEPIALANSAPISGDPYLGLGTTGEAVVRLGKRVVFAAVETAARASRGRWLLGPSIEAWARKPA
jgi:SAM-dependent methyltransferase